jgi:hypothetical protein
MPHFHVPGNADQFAAMAHQPDKGVIIARHHSQRVLEVGNVRVEVA